MIKFFELLFQNEFTVLSICGILFLCYIKSIKYCLMSNCTKIHCLCFDIEKQPMSDENIHEILQTPDEQPRRLGSSA